MPVAALWKPKRIPSLHQARARLRAADASDWTKVMGERAGKLLSNLVNRGKRSLETQGTGHPK